MKRSFTTMATPGCNIQTILTYANQYRYNGIDLRISEKKGELNHKMNLIEIQAIKEQFKEKNVEITSLFSYHKKPIDESSGFDLYYDSISKDIEIANEIGAKAIRIMGGPIGTSKNPSKYLNKTKTTIERLLKNSNNCTLVMQNHIGDFNLNQSVALAKLISSKKFKLAFDPSHCIRMNELDFKETYSKLSKYIYALYISDLTKDSNGYSHALPGTGILDISSFIYDLDIPLITFKWPKIHNQSLEDATISLPFFTNTIDKITS